MFSCSHEKDTSQNAAADTTGGGWWIPTSNSQIAEAEAAMIRDGYAGDVIIDDVPAGADGHTIHTIRIPAPKAPVDANQAASSVPVVLLHGMGLGCAAWSPSFSTLAEGGQEVLSLDWPGYGRSSRPKFPLHEGVDACESFFVERIECWRQSLGIRKMVMIGHSFGGYFSACYAMKYPQHVERLVLVSPVGMNEKKKGPVTDPALRAELPWKRRLWLNTADYMWSSYWTPGAVVRTLGPLGHWPVGRYVTNRFTRSRQAGTFGLNDEVMKEYLYHVCAQPGCSEFCLNELLDFGAWAKCPLGNRLVERFQQLKDNAPPVTFMYGEHDWMDSDSGLRLGNMLPGASECFIVEGAGHQIIIEGPRAFNATLQRVLCGGPDAQKGLYHRLCVE